MRMQVDGDWTVDDVAGRLPTAAQDAREILAAMRSQGITDGAKVRRATSRRRGSSWRKFAMSLEVHAAEEARRDPDVVAFRRDVIGGQLVDHRHVDEWVRSHHGDLVPLKELASALASVHNWTLRHAALFVVTDLIPPRAALRTEYLIRIGTGQPSRVVVTAEAWVPPEAVAAAYRRLRDRRRPDRPGDRPVERRARAIHPRIVALVTFLDQTPGSWAERLTAWNTANPKARFRDRANFRRAYERARRRLDVTPEVIYG